MPGAVKNAIDHASRRYGQSVWGGKPAGVLGVSIGAVGTARSLKLFASGSFFTSLRILAVPLFSASRTWLAMRRYSASNSPCIALHPPSPGIHIGPTVGEKAGEIEPRTRQQALEVRLSGESECSACWFAAPA
jgi:hypothetical protein